MGIFILNSCAMAQTADVISDWSENSDRLCLRLGSAYSKEFIHSQRYPIELQKVEVANKNMFGHIY